MEKEALVINLFGGPGCGKSTTAAGLFSLLKLHDIECELATEYAKDLVWEERHRTFGDQHYIFGKQHHRIWRLKDKVNVVITDSPILLSVIYRPETLGESFVRNVIDTVNSFNNFNIVLRRTKKFNPNGRNQDENESKAIDEQIKDILIENNMPWIEVPGNLYGLNNVVKLVLDNLKVEQKFKISNK